MSTKQEEKKKLSKGTIAGIVLLSIGFLACMCVLTFTSKDSPKRGISMGFSLIMVLIGFILMIKGLGNDGIISK